MPAPPRCSGQQVCRRLPAARFLRAALPWLELRPESGVQKGTGSCGGVVLASWGCFLESLALQLHVRPWSQQEPHNRVCISGRLPARSGAKTAACLHLGIQGEGAWHLVLLQIFLCSSIALVILSTELEKGWLYLLVGHQGLGNAGEPVSSEAGENPGSPRCAALRDGISS